MQGIFRVICHLQTIWQTMRCYVRLGLAQILARRPVIRSSGANSHLVILAWQFPPDITGGVYRPAALARYAQKSGYRVTVFAGPLCDGPTEAGISMLDYVGPDIDIVRLSSSTPPPSYRLFPFVDGGMYLAVDLFFKAQAHLRASPPDIILASGPPFHVFVAGVWLARRLGANLVLDYRDEWTLCPFEFVSSTLQERKWEERALRQADRVLFVTQSLLETCSAEMAVPGLREKSRLTPNGWEPTAGNSTDRLVDTLAVHGEPGKIVLLFAGMLGEHTKVQPFLDALEQILKKRPEWEKILIVRFLGKQAPAESSLLKRFAFPQVIDCAGLVPLAEATRQMRAADALLLFHDPRMDRSFPGKLYEYLAAGRPILLFNDQGESKRAITALSAGWAIDSTDLAQFEQILAGLINRNVVLEDNLVRDEWLQRHTRQAVVSELLRDLATLKLENYK